MADEKIPRRPTEISVPKAAKLSESVKGSQAPANHILPAHTTTKGDDAVEFLRLVGIQLDPWQELVLRESLNVGPDDKWAATEVCLLVPRQQGKIEPLDSIILTCDNGWKTFSQLTPGDRVFHPDGTPATITYVTEPHEYDFYRVTTTDGRTGIYGADHLWTVTDKCRERSVGPRGARKRYFEAVTLTTREMFETGVSRYTQGSRSTTLNGKSYTTNEYRYTLPRQHALQELPKNNNLPIDPYLLGVWLGDGSNRGGVITSAVTEMAHWRQQFVIAHERVDPKKRNCQTFTVEGFSVDQLRELGVYRNKHVPEEYLLACDRQREALLQGLMDTDGSITAGGQAEFCNTNKQIAESVLFLVRSLGWRAVLSEGRAKLNGKDYGPKYLVKFTPKRCDPYTPFRMERKLARVGEKDGGKGRFTVSIKSIEPVGRKVGRCIKVDREDGLYLSGRDLIPTHNTVVAECRELVGLFMLGEKLIVHQAQMFSTAKESFYRQCARIKACPDLRAMVSKFRSGNDNVGIELETGGRLLYQARGPDSLRGFSIDLLVMDEAYALTPEVMAAALHATSAMVDPQIWYCSSTGREDSQVLHDLRERALARAPRVGLWEWKADDGCDPKDEQQWAKANPALGIRLSKDFIYTEGEAGKWGKEFKRERLGLWADPTVADVIPMDLWKQCADPESQIVGDDLIAAVDVSPYRDCASVAMCGIAADGRRQVEVIQSGSGTDWVVDFVKKLMMSSQPPLKIAIQGCGAPGALIAPLMQIGAELIVLGSSDIGRGTGEFSEAIKNKQLVHLDDPLIDRALSNATRYNIGSKEGASESPAWGFARKDMNAADITPIVACCYAYYGMSKYYAEEAKKPVPAHVGAPIGGRIW